MTIEPAQPAELTRAIVRHHEAPGPGRRQAGYEWPAVATSATATSGLLGIWLSDDYRYC